MKFKKSDKIQFISTIEGLESIEECLPRPAKHFIPKWFKDIPSRVEDAATVKACPSFPDYFSQGYIVPMWTDTRLTKKGEEWTWQVSSELFSVGTHGDAQFLEYVTPNFNGVDGQFIFKAFCPWNIITPPGWSVLQLPLFYHFNQEWSVLPGVIDTDIHHTINQQIVYHGNGKTVSIDSGDPFVLYIPFKRSNKLKHEIKYQSKEHERMFKINTLSISKSFILGGAYRELQRKRDKKD